MPKPARKPRSVYPRMEQWSVHTNGNQYLAPELCHTRIGGKVYGHPDRPDGSDIYTSHVLSVRGRVVTCRSRTYRLGEPAPEYLKWMQSQGIAYDPKHPITMKKGV